MSTCWKKEIRTKVKCVAIITFVKAFQLQTFFNRRYFSAFFSGLESKLYQRKKEFCCDEQIKFCWTMHVVGHMKKLSRKMQHEMK